MMIRDCWQSLNINYFFLKFKLTEYAEARKRKAVTLLDKHDTLFIS